MAMLGFSPAEIDLVITLYVAAAETTNGETFRSKMAEIRLLFPSVLAYIEKIPEDRWATSQKGYLSHGTTRSNSAGVPPFAVLIDSVCC